MRGYFNIVGVCALLLAVSAAAQTTVTTSGGTANTVPAFTGTASVGNSPIAISGSNVGIRTTSPQTPLDVEINSNASLFAGITLENTYNGDGNYNSPMLLLGSGGWFNNGQFLRAAALQAVNDNWNVGQKALAFYTYDGHLGNNFASATLADLYERMRISSSGNVGIGTASPGAKLEVNGNIKLTSGSGASITFTDGTVQSTAWTGSLCGGDYAEAVSGAGNRAQYEPGDVLVLSGDDHSDVSKSAQPYSTSVAGIYSTKPGLIGRRRPEKRNTEIPMAMVGIVPTKVSAENGPVRRGDLLVTSSTAGYAMKGTDRSRMLGAIVGKAMGNLKSGTGVIEVLVSLQ